MNWYKKAHIIHDPRIMSNPNFKGFFHQEFGKYNDYDDRITKERAGIHFYEILNRLPSNLFNKKVQSRISQQDLEEFLYENGIRWIFVSYDTPQNKSNSFYILAPDRIILYEFVDPYEKNSTGIVYNLREGRPVLIPTKENDELV